MTVGPCAWWEHRIRARRERVERERVDVLQLRDATGRIMYQRLQIHGHGSTLPDGAFWDEYLHGLNIYVNDEYVGKMP